MDLQQFKSKFIDDSLNLLNGLDNALIQFEKTPDDKEIVEQIFRVIHTLKGVSGMYGFNKIVEITHELEHIFNLIREEKIKADNDLCQLTLTSVDHIRALLEDEEFLNIQNIARQELLTDKIHRILKKYSLQSAKTIIKKIDNQEIKTRTWQILFKPDDSIFGRAINLSQTFQDLFSLGEYRIDMPNEENGTDYWSIYLITDKPKDDIEDSILFLSDYCRLQLIADFNIFLAEEIEKRENAIAELTKSAKEEEHHEEKIIDKQEIRTEFSKVSKITSTKITVDSEKLDTLMYLVSELVTTKSELLLSIEENNTEKILESADKVDKLSKLFRDNALELRLVSFQEMLSRFNRLIRDLSVSLGKKIHFEIQGEHTELDKNIIDTIAEPIMHIIRNCIDHGIETPNERLKSYKSETGMVKFFAFKSGNFVFIQVSDDGRGIDPDKIKQKAISKGIIHDYDILSQKELINLIFLPGFSTAESLSEVSGRGVGMDIVKKKIEDLRGEITIESEVGLGTSFTIKLQQTISIIDTLLISCDNLKMAIPLEDVENCEIILNDAVINRNNCQIQYNEELIPFINLHKEFDVRTEHPEKWRTIIVNKHDKKFAILTDNIIGEFQAVIKPVGKMFYNQDFISGASILGDGSIALLLDTDKLKKLIVASKN